MLSLEKPTPRFAIGQRVRSWNDPIRPGVVHSIEYPRYEFVDSPPRWDMPVYHVRLDGWAAIRVFREDALSAED